MTNKFRLAITGCGDIAGYMALMVRLTPGVQLAACCDVSRERAEAFANRHRIKKVHTHHRQMLDEEPMDAVYLAVPHDLHFELIREAVDARVPVLVEKPVTRTLVEGAKITNYAQEKGIKLGVNYQYRYDKGCYKLARTVQEGALGRVFYARVNVPWHRERDYFEDSPWHKTIARSGGGTLITQASHFIDILLWALGSAPAWASGYTAQNVFKEVEVEDYAAGTIGLANEAVIQVTSSMAAAREGAVTMEVYGEGGMAAYTDRPWPRVRLKLEAVGNLPPIPSSGVPQRGVHALQRSLKGFCSWVAGGEEYLVPAVESLPVLAAVEAFYQSANEGCRIEIQGG
jgi:predicted dehydrogenase